jgi:phenylalanyl-tRNA synthetase beta chain
MLAGLTAGAAEPFFSVKGVVEFILGISNIAPEKIKYLSLTDFRKMKPKNWLWSWSYFNELKSQVVLAGDQVIGIFGELDWQEAQEFKIKSAVSLFELDFQFLSTKYPRVKQFREISVYPSVIRDLSFVVDKKYSYQAISTELKKLQQAWTNLVDFELFDIFDDKKLGDRRSLTFRFVLQEDRTFTAEMIDEATQRIIGVLKNKFNAELRTR